MLLGDGKRWLAVLTAFLDESGTHAGCPVVTVAGFYGNAEQWAAFRSAWEPHSSGFHAKDCEVRFPKLVEAIIASKINGMCITLGKQTYRKNATKQMLSRAGNEYAMCAFQCVLTICREVVSPTAFVLEHGQPNLEFVLKTLLYMLDAGDACISSVTPAKKTDFIELHPADFVSHLASSNDEAGLQKLFKAHRLKHGHIQGKSLDEVSLELGKNIAQAKRERIRAKKHR
jgi:hypothetical protein